MALTARRGVRKGVRKGEWRVRQSRKDTSRAWKVRVTLRLRQRQGQAVRQMKGLRNGLRQELSQRQGYCAALGCGTGGSVAFMEFDKTTTTNTSTLIECTAIIFVVIVLWFLASFSRNLLFSNRGSGAPKTPQRKCTHCAGRQATASRRRTTNYSLVEILWSLSWPPLKHFFKADAFLYCLLLF